MCSLIKPQRRRAASVALTSLAQPGQKCVCDHPVWSDLLQFSWSEKGTEACGLDPLASSVGRHNASCTRRASLIGQRLETVKNGSNSAFKLW